MQTDECTGVLLAGGKSSRFGTNKATTKLSGRLLIEHPANVLAALFKKLLLVTNTPAEYDFLDWKMTGDIYPDAGPLAGIHAALKLTDTPLIFVTGCDMPFLDKKLISYLCSLSDGYDLVVPRTAMGLEPLHAIYHQKAIGIIEENLNRGDRKTHKVFSDLKIREVCESEILTIVDNFDSFRNINTPEDLPV